MSDWCTCFVLKWITWPPRSCVEVACAAVATPVAAISAAVAMPSRVRVARLMRSLLGGLAGDDVAAAAADTGGGASGLVGRGAAFAELGHGVVDALRHAQAV